MTKVQFPRLLRFGFAKTAGLYLLLSGLQAFSAPIRIALINFTVEELSYRSSKAALDLTGVLQAELSSNPPAGVEFVERTELDRAATELQLGGVGLADRRDGLRAGHWARADWAVLGTLLTNRSASESRVLRLEIVELARASVLSATNLAVKSQSKTHFSPDSAEFQRLANEVSGWLSGEALLESSRRGAVIVAAIPLVGRPEATVDWDSPTIASPVPIRLLSLDAPAKATRETDLLLTGFTSGKPVLALPAEFFIWPEEPPAKAAGRFVVWDGRGTPLSVRLTNGLSAEGPLGSVLPAMRQERAGQAEQPHFRERLAEQLMAQGRAEANPPALRLRQWELAVWLSPTNPIAWEGWIRFRWENWESEPSYERFPRGEFNHQRHRFEAWADYLDRFANPAGAGASPETVQTPAGAFARAVAVAIETTQDGDAKSQAGIPDDVSGTVLAEWRQRFVSGLVSRLPMLLTQEDVRTNAGPLLDVLLVDMGQGANRDEARKRLAPFEQLWALAGKHQRQHLGQWADGAYVLEEFFVAAGQKERAAKYVAEAKAVRDEWRTAAKGKTELLATNTVATLPRIHLLDEAGRQHFWTLDGISFCPPTLPHTGQRIEFAAKDGVTSLNAVAHAGGRLWLWAERAKTGNNEPDQGLQPSGFSLWTVTSTNSAPQLAQIPVAVNSVTGVVGDGDELWLTRTDGLTVWNVTSGAVRHLGTNDGLPQGRIWRVALQGSQVLALGRDLVWSTNRGTNWVRVPLASARSVSPAHPSAPPFQASWLLGASGGSGLVVAGGGVIHSGALGHAWATNTQLAVSRPGAWSIPPLLAVAEEKGFWVAGLQGLHRLDQGSAPQKEIHVMPLPGHGRFLPPYFSELPRWITNATPPSVVQGLVRSLAGRAQLTNGPMLARLTEHVSAMIVAGDFLWVTSSSYGHEVAACYDTRRHGWVGAVPLPRKGLWLEQLGNRLGVFWPPTADDSSAGIILKLPSASELAARSVVPDTISEAELITRTSSLPVIQQAITALFTGHPRRILKLLDDGGAEASGPEALALLALACDPSGLDRPEESRRWAELSRRDFPTSVFTRTVWLDRCRRAALLRLAARTTGEATPAALLRDYDASSDGALDLLELELGVACEPLRFRPKGGMIPSAHSLPTLLVRFDRNQNQGLAADELELMLASPAARPPTGQP